MPFQAYYLSPEGKLQRDLTESEIKTAFDSKKGLLWVDIVETNTEDGRLLGQTLGLHPLAVEDCVSPHIHHPKIDDFGDYVFIVVHGINHATESEIVETAEMASFSVPTLW